MSDYYRDLQQRLLESFTGHDVDGYLGVIDRPNTAEGVRQSIQLNQRKAILDIFVATILNTVREINEKHDVITYPKEPHR